MTFDRRVLDAWIAQHAAAKRLTPTPASVALVGRRLIISPDVTGIAVDQGKLAAALAPVLADPSAPAPIDAASTPVTLESSSNDVDVVGTKIAVAQMARPVTLALGGRQFTFSSKRVRAWLELVAGPHGSVPVIDPAAVSADVATLAKKVKRKPLETRFLITKAGKKFGFVAGRPGRQLDTATTSQRVVARVIGRRVGLPESGAIALATRGVEIKLSAAEASQIVPQVVLLSSWTTYFPQGSHNGNGVNIHLPARIINGMVIRPGAIIRLRAHGRTALLGARLPHGRRHPGRSHRSDRCRRRRHLLSLDDRLQRGRPGGPRHPDPRQPLATTSRAIRSGSTPRSRRRPDASSRTCASATTRRIRSSSARSTASAGCGSNSSPSSRRARSASADRRSRTASAPRTGSCAPADFGSARASAPNTPPTGWMSRSRARCATCMVGSSISETFRSHYVLWNGILMVGTRR